MCEEGSPPDPSPLKALEGEATSQEGLHVVRLWQHRIRQTSNVERMAVMIASTGDARNDIRNNNSTAVTKRTSCSIT